MRDTAVERSFVIPSETGIISVESMSEPLLLDGELSYEQRMQVSSRLVFLWNESVDEDDLRAMKESFHMAVPVLKDPLSHKGPSPESLQRVKSNRLVLQGIPGFVNLDEASVNWISEFSQVLKLDETESARLLIKCHQLLSDQNMANNEGIMKTAASELFFEERYIQLQNLYMLGLEAVYGQGPKAMFVKNFLYELKGESLVSNLLKELSESSSRKLPTSLNSFRDRELKLLCRFIILLSEIPAPSTEADNNSLLDAIATVSHNYNLELVHARSEASAVYNPLSEVCSTLLLSVFLKFGRSESEFANSFKQFISRGSSANNIAIPSGIAPALRLLLSIAPGMNDNTLVPASSLKAFMPVLKIWNGPLLTSLSPIEQTLKESCSETLLKLISAFCQRILENSLRFHSDQEESKTVSVFPRIWAFIQQICHKNQALQLFFWKDTSLCQYLQMSSLYFDMRSGKISLLTHLLASLCSCDSQDDSSSNALYVYDFVAGSRNLQWNFIFENLHQVAVEFEAFSFSESRIGNWRRTGYASRPNSRNSQGFSDHISLKKSDFRSLTSLIELIGELGKHSATRQLLVDDQFGLIDLLLRLLRCDFLNLPEDAGSLDGSEDSLKQLGLNFLIKSMSTLTVFFQHDPSLSFQNWSVLESSIVGLITSANDFKNMEQSIEYCVRHIYSSDLKNNDSGKMDFSSAYVRLIASFVRNICDHGTDRIPSAMSSLVVHVHYIIGLYLSKDTFGYLDRSLSLELFYLVFITLRSLRNDCVPKINLVGELHFLVARCVFSDLGFVSNLIEIIQGLSEELAIISKSTSEVSEKIIDEVSDCLDYAMSLVWMMCNCEATAHALAPSDSIVSTTDFLVQQNGFMITLTELLANSKSSLTTFICLCFFENISDASRLLVMLRGNNRLSEFCSAISILMGLDVYPDDKLDQRLVPYLTELYGMDELNSLDQELLCRKSISIISAHLKSEIPNLSLSLLGINSSSFSSPVLIDEDGLLFKVLDLCQQKRLCLDHPKIAETLFGLILKLINHSSIGTSVLDRILNFLPYLFLDQTLDLLEILNTSELSTSQHFTILSHLLQSLGKSLQYSTEHDVGRDFPTSSSAFQKLGLVPTVKLLRQFFISSADSELTFFEDNRPGLGSILKYIQSFGRIHSLVIDADVVSNLTNPESCKIYQQHFRYIWDLDKIKQDISSRLPQEETERIISVSLRHNRNISTYSSFLGCIKGWSDIVSNFGTCVGSICSDNENDIIFCQDVVIHLLKETLSTMSMFPAHHEITDLLALCCTFLPVGFRNLVQKMQTRKSISASSHFPVSNSIIGVFVSFGEAIRSCQSQSGRSDLFKGFTIFLNATKSSDDLDFNSAIERLYSIPSWMPMITHCFSDIIDGPIDSQISGILLLTLVISESQFGLDSVRSVLEDDWLRKIINSSLFAHSSRFSQFISDGKAVDVPVLYKACMNLLNRISQSESGCHILVHSQAIPALMSTKFLEFDSSSSALSEDLSSRRARYHDVVLPFLSLVLGALSPSPDSSSKYYEAHFQISKALFHSDARFLTHAIEMRDSSPESLRSVGMITSIMCSLVFGPVKAVADVHSSPLVKWVPALAWEYFSLFKQLWGIHSEHTVFSTILLPGSEESKYFLREILYNLTLLLTNLYSDSNSFESAQHQQSLGGQLLVSFEISIMKDLTIALEQTSSDQSNSRVCEIIRLNTAILRLINQNPFGFVGARHVESLNILRSTSARLKLVSSLLDHRGTSVSKLEKEIASLEHVLHRSPVSGTFSSLIPEYK